MAGPGQILMEVRQTPDGGWGLVPYVPPAPAQPGMGQAAAAAPPQPSWGGLALVLGGTGLALWWAYKRWWKTDDGSKPARDREHGSGYEREDVRDRTRSHGGERTRSGGYRGSSGGGHSRYGSSYGREAWDAKRRGREEARETTARPDERRSRRSKARLMAEYKRLLESQGL
jgi:hypothetical protein